MLPSTPLEFPKETTQGATYLDYWSRQQEVYPHLKSAADIAALALAGSRYVRDDSEEPPHFPTRLISEETLESPAAIIEEWDKSLGPFNPMRAGGDLLRGAATLLRGNHEGLPTMFPVVTHPNPRSVTESFLDIASRVRMSDQVPSRALLIGAQLVHKAGIVERNEAVQKPLLKIAKRMYRRVGDRSTWDLDTLMAREYAVDIEFHQLSSRIREAYREKRDIDQYRGEAVALLRGRVQDLLRIPQMDPAVVPERHQAGIAFELITKQGVRQLVYLDPKLRGFHPEIRSGFNSEDMPLEPCERKFSSKFDSVLTSVTSNGRIIGAEPWQNKLGRSQEMRPVKYHPSIKIIIGQLTMAQMMDGARGLLDTYGEKRFVKPGRSFARVREIIEPHLEHARAA